MIPNKQILYVEIRNKIHVIVNNCHFVGAFGKEKPRHVPC